MVAPVFLLGGVEIEPLVHADELHYFQDVLAYFQILEVDAHKTHWQQELFQVLHGEVSAGLDEVAEGVKLVRVLVPLRVRLDDAVEPFFDLEFVDGFVVPVLLEVDDGVLGAQNLGTEHVLQLVFVQIEDTVALYHGVEQQQNQLLVQAALSAIGIRFSLRYFGAGQHQKVEQLVVVRDQHTARSVVHVHVGLFAHLLDQVDDIGSHRLTLQNLEEHHLGFDPQVDVQVDEVFLGVLGFGVYQEVE
mmetsp:Transcript_78038/g.168749  ORF Transcript_78038/g.168749 Transcript_78038/m.168749 type:complete len:246 (+) Transcript_78038:920-1657(+)